MNVTEAREAIYELTKLYFQEAVVKYARQSFSVKNKKPLVSISFGSVVRPLNPPIEIIDGRPAAYYPTTMQVQIDLFTQGKQRDIANGITPTMENTAAEDMMMFANYLNSPYVIQYCHKKDMAIIIPNTVQDLTDLINDTNFEFRAMLELELRFTTVALGYTGTLSLDSIKNETEVSPEIEVSPSGGGNADLTSEEKDYFTNVEINDKIMKEET